MENLPTSILTRNQGSKHPIYFREGVTDFLLDVSLRYDDECGNGHNTFAITGTLKEKSKTTGRWIEIAGGCLHDDIEKHAPQFAHLIKWHLCSSDGPMHYLANSIYLASDKDCWGKRKGEERSWKTEIFFDNVPIPAGNYPEKFVKWLQENTPTSPHLWPEVKEIAYVHKPGSGTDYKFSPHYTLEGFGSTWYDCPFKDKQEAENFRKALNTCTIHFRKVCTSWGEGKEPELEAARAAAIWPEAQLEDFTVEKLTARLPALMQEFKAVVEGLGFTY